MASITAKEEIRRIRLGRTAEKLQQAIADQQLREGAKPPFRHGVVTPVFAETVQYAKMDEVRLVDPTEAAITVILPILKPTDSSQQIVVYNYSSSGNNITIASSGSDLINGSETTVFGAAYTGAVLLASPVGWVRYII